MTVQKFSHKICSFTKHPYDSKELPKHVAIVYSFFMAIYTDPLTKQLIVIGSSQKFAKKNVS